MRFFIRFREEIKKDSQRLLIENSTEFNRSERELIWSGRDPHEASGNSCSSAINERRRQILVVGIA